jgi:hypothetical protein
MFSGCTLLEKSPVLLAKRLVKSCYSNMFNGCNSLKYIYSDFSSWVDGATTNWLKDVCEEG